MSRWRRAPMASLGILMSVWAWNQFLLALVLVEDPTQRTMAGALGAFQGHYATDIPLLSAGTIIILVPTLLRVHRLPAPGHRGPAPGVGEGMTSPMTACASHRVPQLLTYPGFRSAATCVPLGDLLEGPARAGLPRRPCPAALPVVG